MSASTLKNAVKRSRVTAFLLSFIISVAEFPGASALHDEPQFVDVRNILFEYLAYVLTVGLIGTLCIILGAMAVSGLLRFSTFFQGN